MQCDFYPTDLQSYASGPLRRGPDCFFYCWAADFTYDRPAARSFKAARGLSQGEKGQGEKGQGEKDKVKRAR